MIQDVMNTEVALHNEVRPATEKTYAPSFPSLAGKGMNLREADVKTVRDERITACFYNAIS